MESNNNGSFKNNNEQENQLSFSSHNKLVSSSLNYINTINSKTNSINPFLNSHINFDSNGLDTLDNGRLSYNEHCMGINEEQIVNENLITVELLPLCDLLFNIISLATYFCDVVFDSVTIYTLYLEKNYLWFSLALAFVFSSSIFGQVLSLLWYSRRLIKVESSFDLSKPQNLTLVLIHVFQFGVLWRYFKLFLPVDLSTVKHEVRDLCMLRMVHAFTEAGPLLLIQVYLLFLKTSINQITDLNIISTCLSIFNLCWALASFNKNVTRKNMHKLILTWLGVIFQFLWRIGTISSRIVALAIYATFYHYWIFFVIILHWLSMLIWLLSPVNLLNGLKKNFVKRFFYLTLIAWVYVFCYINLKEASSRNRVIVFYGIMFLENIILLLFSININPSVWYHQFAVIIIWVGFFLGILFMIMYYKFFHIRHLKHNLFSCNYESSESNARLYSNIYQKISGKTCEINEPTKLPMSNLNVITGIPGVFNCRLNPALKRKKKKPTTFIPPPTSALSVNTYSSNFISNKSDVTLNKYPHKTISNASKNLKLDAGNIFQGDNVNVDNFLTTYSNVTNFNCTKVQSENLKNLNSLLPQASLSSVSSYTTKLNIPNSTNNCNNQINLTGNISDQELETSSRINIAKKLQEKKLQQLNQLREIEKEIKQKKPKPLEIYSSPFFPNNCPPVTKKKPLNAEKLEKSRIKSSCVLPYYYYYYHPTHRKMKYRSQTPEVLLIPHYLEKSRVYYEYPKCVFPKRVCSRLPKLINDEDSTLDEDDEDSTYDLPRTETLEPPINKSSNTTNLKLKESKVLNLASNRSNTSDIESQISLARSYTLPKEFRFYKSKKLGKVKFRKHVKREQVHEIPSNNSSDADVDSDFNTVDETLGIPKIIKNSNKTLTFKTKAHRSRHKK